MIASKQFSLLLLLLAHACARPDELPAKLLTERVSEASASAAASPSPSPPPPTVTQSIESPIATTIATTPAERSVESEKLETPAAPTTTAVSPLPESSTSTEVPEYLKNCFYAEEKLCLNWLATGNDPNAAERNDAGNAGGQQESGDSVAAPTATAGSAAGDPSENLTMNSGQVGSHDRDINSCQCREHPTRPGSWYCCNLSHINMISSCGNISKWTNLHVRNLTVPALDLLNSMFRSLQSLAITDGNITQLTNAFPKFSALRCLDFSNNKIVEIAPRAVKDVPHLEFFGIANNLLSRVPNRNQNKNMPLDISGNMRMLCEPLNDLIYTDSFIFVNPDRSFCLYNATHKWFNSTDLVSVKQLESIKKCGTKCPTNCVCNIYNIMIIQNDQSKTVCNVDCSNLGLVELPQQLPDNTFTLNISNNRISSLGDHFHTNPTYYNIVKLVADNNQISSIYEFEGTKFIEHFQRLYMRNNSLSKIPEYFLNNALMDTDGRRIYLAENRLQCDCNSAKTLQNWLKERSTDIPDYMDIRCRNLPQSVIELQESKLCQSPPDWTDYIYYLIAAEVILLLALITKVSYDYWVFKTSGYLPWPASKMPKLPCDWLCES
ncbi:protein halfway [Drosophila sulfurigaster albostrigata]|uniref:protein halfway n=2 Tax=nasuta subgroup TaxID=32307 RepID=UPI002D21AF17|nr:protein halfway [Drosophila sulfurigaster albostrigata]